MTAESLGSTPIDEMLISAQARIQGTYQSYTGVKRKCELLGSLWENVKEIEKENEALGMKDEMMPQT